MSPTQHGRHRRVAAIDVGTNSTRLLVAEVAPDGPKDITRRLLFTRLGQGIDASGHLAPDAIARTVDAIGTYVAICNDLGVSAIRAAGTSAVREAANRAELLQEIVDAHGLELEVIAGEEEATLSFAGATADLPDGRYLVCDIGGGSTEFALGEPARRGDATAGHGLLGQVSLPLGVVRMTERHLHADPTQASELTDLEADVDGILATAVAELPGAGGATLVAVAGTATSLAAIQLGLTTYDPEKVHGATLAREAVDALYRRLASMTLAERQTMPALPPGRADVIVAGCAILSRTMAAPGNGGAFPGWPRLRVSEKDILDGLVLSLVT